MTDEREVSSLDIADQITAIWEMGKTGAGTPEDVAHAAGVLGKMLSEYARRGGRLDAIAHSLGLLGWDDPEDRDDP